MEPENNFIQRITEKDLPRKWKNVIISEKSNFEAGEFYIRSNISNLKECNDWVTIFSKHTFTQWNNRSSRPNASTRFVCQKKFVCHRSSYNKTTSNKRGQSKNTNCLARISLSVKVTTTHTKRTDPFLKAGMPGIIQISAGHNHHLVSLSALKYLTPSRDLQEAFFEYFEKGLGLINACRYHENKLLVESGGNSTVNGVNILDNPRFNPSRRTVQHWFERWRKAPDVQIDDSDLKEEEDESIYDTIIVSYIDAENEKDQDTLPNSEHEIHDNDHLYQLPCESPKSEISSILQPSPNSNMIDFHEEIDLPFQQDSAIKNVIKKMEDLHEKFGSSDLAEQAAYKLAVRLNQIKSSDEWASFLHTAAKSFPLRRADDLKI